MPEAHRRVLPRRLAAHRRHGLPRRRRTICSWSSAKRTSSSAAVSTCIPRTSRKCCTDHPSVGECAVVGVPDALLGEQVCACIVLRPASQVTAGGTDRALSGQLGQVQDAPLRGVRGALCPRPPSGRSRKRSCVSGRRPSSPTRLPSPPKQSESARGSRSAARGEAAGKASHTTSAITRFGRRRRRRERPAPRRTRILTRRPRR